MFLGKCSYQLANSNHTNLFCSVAMVKFGKTEIAKEKFYAPKKAMEICIVNVDNVVISKVVKIKTNSKYLIRYSDIQIYIEI